MKGRNFWGFDVRQILKAWSERIFMGDAAQITCPNPNCQASNPETNRFCQQCGTPVPKRYLWAVGFGKESYKPGQLLAQRYAVKRDRILLDTKPGFIPSFPQDITDAIAPYLRLFPYRLHVPQVYGLLPPHKKNQKEAVLLLEQAPILGDKKSSLPNLMPELGAAWKKANGMRQLNWLWQIAQLWQPFSEAGVATSLLSEELLRVEGPLVRLLELRQDREEASLSDLGQMWLQWVKEAKPALAGFLEQLCQQTIQGEVFPEELVAQLDRALFTIGRSQSGTYQIATSTDTGPTRVRNEDACYPSSNSFYQIPPGQALAVVCDGIGGHEGGNVASNLAIETVVAQAQGWQNLPLGPDSSNLDAIAELEHTVCEANDRISELNDIEGRYDRQRMGTTLVMAAARAHEIYIAHIGDSRVYWITRTGCHQVTLDDDVASREVRLGYALYREALQQLGSGSLVQALGMSSSKSLHPTVQRFVIDEDCIFLLCSDGLSDNDRVEQYWDTEILPVLDGNLDLPTAAANLIEIGNSQNGHDNVTVALVYCRVTGGESTDITSQTSSLTELPWTGSTVSTESETPHPLKTRLLPTQLQKPSLLPLLGGIALLLVLGGALAYFAVGKWGDRPILNPAQSPEPKPHSPSLASPLKSSDSERDLSPGSLIQVRSNSPNQKVPLLLYEAPQKQTALGMVPENSVLEIKSKALIEQDRWLKLKLCSIPSAISSDRLPGTYNLIKPTQEGWIRQADLEPYIRQNSIQESARLPKCTPGTTSTTPLPPQSK